MHLSISSPDGGGVGRATHGNLTEACILRVGILIGRHVPRVGNSGMVTILDIGENLEMSRHLRNYPEGI